MKRYDGDKLIDHCGECSRCVTTYEDGPSQMGIGSTRYEKYKCSKYNFGVVYGVISEKCRLPILKDIKVWFNCIDDRPRNPKRFDLWVHYRPFEESWAIAIYDLRWETYCLTPEKQAIENVIGVPIPNEVKHE